MSDIVERIEAALICRPIPSELLREAADEIKRLRTRYDSATDQAVRYADEIERLRAVIMRAKDALLDGQSTQWVHDLLVAALVEPKP